MAGRQDGLLRPVEQEYEIICEGGSLAGHHHPHHLHHYWHLDPVAHCQNGS